MNAVEVHRPGLAWAVVVGALASATALAAPRAALFGAAGLAGLILLATWLLRRRDRWITVFLVACLCLPPLPFALGNSGPHPGLAIAVIGLIAGAIFINSSELRFPRAALAFPLYILALLASIFFAALYSGPALAAASLARIALFCISAYVFFFTLAGSVGTEVRVLRILFWSAVASAAFACADFYFQFPAPAGFGPQFIWIGSVIQRRAQGFFYESSTLGNVCVFFLLLIAVCLARPRSESPASRPALVGAGGVFLAALLLSFSRASVIALGVGLLALAVIQADHRRLIQATVYLAVAVVCAFAVLSWVAPDLVQFLGVRSVASIDLASSGNARVLSGRLETWRVLTGFLMDNPQYAIFGVGYKTLPYSDFVGRITVADNAYLSALVETGLIGLTALLLLHVAILRMAWKARASLYGTWIFSFWTAEIVQMLTGDLLTYWRVLPLYFWALAVAVRNTQRVPA